LGRRPFCLPGSGEKIDSDPIHPHAERTTAALALMWIAAQLLPRREALALHCLALEGFATYLPRCRERRVVRGRKIEATPPLFPGYLFIGIEAQWHAARWSPGIVGLIMDGIVPARVPDAIIADIRARERRARHAAMAAAAACRALRPRHAERRTPPLVRLLNHRCVSSYGNRFISTQTVPGGLLISNAFPFPKSLGNVPDICRSCGTSCAAVPWTGGMLAGT